MESYIQKSSPSDKTSIRKSEKIAQFHGFKTEFMIAISPHKEELHQHICRVYHLKYLPVNSHTQLPNSNNIHTHTQKKKRNTSEKNKDLAS